MTRGKHGASAAARKLIGERDQEIAAYQHNIRKLTAENAELKQKIIDMQSAHSQTVRTLKAERDEGLSPQLTVLQRENERMSQRVDQAERLASATRDWFKATFDRLADHLTAHSPDGLTRLEAIRLTHSILGDPMGGEWRPPEIHGKIDDEGARRIERARGWTR